mmetsp:Transcript_9894/g.17830  ORF Transcript_9894/g.17830 Transcript_9894/m.17830 type:complete len:269 (-) Transcript_9894:38-844(-)|eukprot:CAMPEP_0182441098 /NCGR_PEP_ID=MMETSP1172-20130603/53_1 /TAXON_ID=708627 /ORGANISM="Timspurckia oligopyrenoides, Strain CCMP3278" /LENGTH=268 /DNA_ID=CAMNT_0024635243 /DNA_START=85 /DNA_END=891 /DNA_ORIENTATION=+
MAAVVDSLKLMEAAAESLQPSCAPSYEELMRFIDEVKQDGERSELDLQQLCLSDEIMEKLSDPICELAPKLKCLNLFLNELTHVPKWISKLDKLQTLLIGANPLVSIDDQCLNGLNQLEVLDIGFGEKLQSLPEQIGKYVPKLKVLKAGNSRISKIPQSISLLNDLEELYLYGNCISEFPIEICELSSLRVLNLGRNQLTTVPEQIESLQKSLQELQLYDNDIHKFPKSIANLKLLKVLNVNHNARLPIPPRDIHRAGIQATLSFYAQ